jgi:hypothetical protein
MTPIRLIHDLFVVSSYLFRPSALADVFPWKHNRRLPELQELWVSEGALKAEIPP